MAVNNQRMPQIKPEEALQLDAYIRISRGQISLLLQDKEQTNSPPIVENFFYNKVAGIDGLTETVYNTQLLTLPYRSTTLYLDNGAPYVLVPKDLEGDEPSSMPWLHLAAPTEGEQLLISPIESERLSVHWSVPQATYDFCQRSFPMARFQHPVLPFITTSTTYTRRQHPRVVMAYWADQWLDLLYTTDGRLALANRYQARTSVDVLYHTTAIWRQFALSATDDHLLLYTRAEEGEVQQLLSHLQTTIRHLYHEEYPDLRAQEWLTPALIGQIPPELILSQLCV